MYIKDYIYILYITLCEFHLLEKEKQRHLQKLPYFICLLLVLVCLKLCQSKAQDLHFSLRSRWFSCPPLVSLKPVFHCRIRLRFRWLLGIWDSNVVSKAPELWRIVWSRSHFKFWRWEESTPLISIFPHQLKYHKSLKNHEKNDECLMPSLWQLTNMVLWHI